jgi:hypothetical protein
MTSLLSAFNNQTSKDVCLVILVDGSGSVDNSDFKLTKEIVSSFIVSSTRDANDKSQRTTFLTVIQFSTITEVVVDNMALTVEAAAESAKARVEEMKQMKKGTSYISGYQSAKTVFARKGREYVRKVVMITDGKPNEPIELVQGWVRSFLQKGIEIYTVGIGQGVTKSDIDQVSSPGCGYHYNKYIDLANLFGSNRPVDGSTTKSTSKYDMKLVLSKHLRSRDKFEGEISITCPTEGVVPDGYLNFTSW